MAEVKVQSPIQEARKNSKRELYATVCYYYQQYTLEDVQNMSARNVQLLIDTAQKIEAQRMFSLTQIVAAPHTKAGKGVKDLLDYFKKVGKF